MLIDLFSSVLCYCWFGERKGILSVKKTLVTYPQRFSSEKIEEEKLRGTTETADKTKGKEEDSLFFYFVFVSK